MFVFKKNTLFHCLILQNPISDKKNLLNIPDMRDQSQQRLQRRTS
jgi:hypothetical protein